MARNGPGKGQRSLLGGKRGPHGKSKLHSFAHPPFVSASLSCSVQVMKLASMHFMISWNEDLLPDFLQLKILKLCTGTVT